ncbi:hypothetical protein F0U61_43420 [Archangium violaceum]|uniref:hypothetical protein n=1 Tax=Archangium violaceum TaxID=83451 RepID=UPI002B313245|nr:hypothetical protein F0U61_43420 [Archangium violaceum]
MSLDRTQLISIALNYWQSFKDYSQDPSPEDQRRFEVIKQKLQGHDRWLAFQKELKGELTEFDIGDYTGPGPCFCCVAYPRSSSRPQPDLRWVVVGCVSFLAPVYIVYGVQFDYSNSERIFKKLAFWPLPPEIQAAADTIARRIEATFAVTALPHELAELRVPLYVQFTEPPETTLFHALFLDSPENLP